MTEPRERYLRRYYLEHKEQFRAYGRTSTRRLREEVIAMHGGKCACCGEREMVFLGLDHIGGGGGAHRRSLASRGGWKAIYSDLRRSGPRRDLFRVLCRNCNFATWALGYCPHHPKRSDGKKR